MKIDWDKLTEKNPAFHLHKEMFLEYHRQLEEQLQKETLCHHHICADGKWTGIGVGPKPETCDCEERKKLLDLDSMAHNSPHNEWHIAKNLGLGPEWVRVLLCPLCDKPLP